MVCTVQMVHIGFGSEVFGGAGCGLGGVDSTGVAPAGGVVVWPTNESPEDACVIPVV